MNNKLNYPRLWLNIGLLMLLTLIVLSVITLDQSMIPIPYLDKIEHFLAWMLVMFWFVSLYPGRGLPLLAILLTLSLGLELVQALTTWRQGSAGDLLANFLGLLTGWGLAVANQRKLMRFMDRKLAQIMQK